MSNWIALSEIIRNIALAVAAFVGAYLAWRQLSPAASQARAASTQAELARRTHVTELFNRAAGQLRDSNLEVRLAAIYVLREVARDFPDLSDPIFELLQAYLRSGEIDYGDDEPPIDIQEIITLLRSRLEITVSKKKDRSATLDIHGAFVRRTDLSGASLRGANMTRADATNAILRDVDFQDAVLSGTILRGADLTGAKILTVEQLSEAIIDDRTILPKYIDRAKLRGVPANAK